MGVRSEPDLLDPRFVEDPAPLYRWLREQAPVWEVPGTGVWLVSPWDLVTEAVARTDDFSSRLTGLLVRGSAGPELFDMTDVGDATRVLATGDDPDHATHRKLVLPHLSARRVAALNDEVTALFDRLWAEGARDGRIAWAPQVADRLPLAVLARILGLPRDDVPALLPLAYRATELLAGFGDLDRLADLAAGSAELAGYLAAHYAAARRTPGDNLLGDLARKAPAHGVDDDEAVTMLLQLVGAGGESTASLIGNAARMLAEDPPTQHALRADPTLVPAFLEEALRLHSPFRGHYRTVVRDCDLGGVPLAAGARLMLLWGAANRDPARFDNPDTVDLDRPAARNHLAFGKGLHFCVGAALARLEARTAVTGLLHRTRHFHIDPHTPPRWEPSIFVRRQAGLTLRLEPPTP